MEVHPEEVRSLRLRNNWSLQDLSNHSGVNKAYLSEFENGKRKLTEDQLLAIAEAFNRFQPAGSARPDLRVVDGHWRLVFLNEHGEVSFVPAKAHISWAEADGTSYTMFVGKRAD